MQLTNSSNDSRPIFLYHAHKQADFDIDLLTEEALFAWANKEDKFHFLSIYKTSR